MRLGNWLKRGRALTWLRRWAIWGPLALVAALAATAAWGARGRAADDRRFPPPGRLVEVGGRRLHLDCRGVGVPVVVFEGGTGAASIEYAALHERLASHTRTCFYDRAGLGWSDPAPAPPTAAGVVSQLHALLRAAGEPGPYVMAGHSYGGWLARLYAARYPDDVVGMALVEAAHEEQWERLPGRIYDAVERAAGQVRVAAVLARLGLLRVIQGSPHTAVEAVQLRPDHLASVRHELLVAGDMARDVQALAGLGDLPLVVVTAGRSFEAFSELVDLPRPDVDTMWLRLQRELAALSSDSRHVTSPTATHRIQEDDPAIVARTIGALVDDIRRESSAPAASSHRSIPPHVATEDQP